MKKVRWGIVGTGVIAHRFANAIKNVEGARLCAVASRSKETAEKFGGEFGIEHRFSSYEAMAESNEIDAAYIAVPHGLHADCSILFLNAGKAVLCEKPITVNEIELKRMIEASEKNNAFLMEAMWARLVPGTIKLIEIVQSGALGEIMGVQGSFCYDMSDEPGHHAIKPEYGGGSLLDVGVYGLNFASWYIDSKIQSITAAANVNETMVDVHCCMLLKYENGAIADLSSGMLLRKPNEGYVFGTKGYAYVGHFYAPEEIELHINSETKKISAPYLGNGFEEQIIEVNSCILAGKTQSDTVPLSHSMYITKQMDEIRKIIGVKYPFDK